jgi:hypothetical protein
MYVIPQYEILEDRLRAIFPQLAHPNFGWTDFVGEYGASSIPKLGANSTSYSSNDGNNEAGAGGIETDPLRKVIYARHLFVPHSQIYYPAGCTKSYGYNTDTFDPVSKLPTLRWWNFQYSAAPTAFGAIVQPSGYTALAANFSAPADFVIDGCAPRCQGFKAFLEVNPPSTAAPQSLYYAAARWRVTGSTLPPRWYSVSYQMGVGVFFAYNDQIDSKGDPVTASWQQVGDIKQGEGVADILTPNAGITPLPMIDVRLLAGIMTICIGSEDTPFPWPHLAADASGNHDYFIDSFQVAAGKVLGLQWEFHPTKFLPTFSYVSTQTNVGYVPDNSQLAGTTYIAHTAPNFASPTTGQIQPPPTHDVHGNTTQVGFIPPGCTAVATTYDINAFFIRYQLVCTAPVISTYKGQPYADFTPCVRAVSGDIPGLQLPQPPSQLVSLGTAGVVNLPESFQVSHSFELSRLCITRSATMTFNNYYGQWTNSLGTGIVDNRGHFAVEINCGIAGGGSLHTEFIGVANREFTNNWQSGGNDKLTLFCEDLWCMLDVPSWNLPWFDGWNVYSVMAYLAGIGTLTPSQLAFAALVPANPYDLSPGLPDSAQYFMPIGPAGTPLTRFTGGQKLKDIMLKISQSIGFWMYFDHLSLLHCEPFVLPSLSTPAHTFSHVDGDPLHPSQPGVGGIWSGSYKGGLREQRNTIDVIGVNALGPIWNPIVAHSVDIDSVYNDAAANYKGYFDPVVWADNIFTDLTFAQRAADSILAYLRIPDREVQFSTWLQPSGIFPGDVITVITPRSGAQGYRFFVTGTTVSISKGQAPRCDIQARIVPQGA